MEGLEAIDIYIYGYLSISYLSTIPRLRDYSTGRFWVVWSLIVRMALICIIINQQQRIQQISSLLTVYVYIL